MKPLNCVVSVLILTASTFANALDFTCFVGNSMSGTPKQTTVSFTADELKQDFTFKDLKDVNSLKYSLVSSSGKDTGPSFAIYRSKVDKKGYGKTEIIIGMDSSATFNDLVNDVGISCIKN